MRHHLPPMHAGRRTDIDDVVGRQDRILVMLDDNNGVADVSQMLQRLQKAGIVALMQADRGLVENVENPRQARTDLRCQPDALALAARKRTGIA